MFGWLKRHRGTAAVDPSPPFLHLRPGRRHRVVRPFTDHDGLTHPVGEQWTFLRAAFLPYEEGLSLFVATPEGAARPIRLQWRRDAEGPVIDTLHDHVLTLADDADGRVLPLTRDSVGMTDDVNAPHAATPDMPRDGDAVAIAEAILAAACPAWVGENPTWSFEIGADRVLPGYRNGARYVRSIGPRPPCARGRNVERLHLTYLGQGDPAS